VRIGLLFLAQSRKIPARKNARPKKRRNRKNKRGGRSPMKRKADEQRRRAFWHFRMHTKPPGAGEDDRTRRRDQPKKNGVDDLWPLALSFCPGPSRRENGAPRMHVGRNRPTIVPWCDGGFLNTSSRKGKETLTMTDNNRNRLR
jgi:hypothetical protein